MTTIEKSIEVEVPFATAYNQWTQFEEFPRFMDGVEEVGQLDDTHLHWLAEFGGNGRVGRRDHRADAGRAYRLDEPGGAKNAGVVTFHRLTTRSRVMLQLEYEPEGVADRSATSSGATAG